MKLFDSLCTFALACLLSIVFFAATSAAQQRILHSFNGNDGLAPIGNLSGDPSDKLYGAAVQGGNSGCRDDTCGTIFELKRRDDGHHWGFKVIHKFEPVPDGNDPAGGMALDSAGRLYGVTASGGTGTGHDCTIFPNVDVGCGTIFELDPTGEGKWKETILHNFTEDGVDGSDPNAGPILDSHGNLFGTTYEGGLYIGGTVWELSPGASGWTYKILYNFGAPGDASGPFLSRLALDADGNIYGTTYVGGAKDKGTVFKLTPAADGTWTETILHSFGFGTDAEFPYAGVTLDAAGNIYGTAHLGGGGGGQGIVYQLVPALDGTWTENILHVFAGSDGADPQSTVTLDSDGNLYGTTVEGGAKFRGVVYKLSPQADGSWTEQTLLNFNGANGEGYNGSVVLDRHGNVYGTALDGPNSSGLIYELRHSAILADVPH